MYFIKYALFSVWQVVPNSGWNRICFSDLMAGHEAYVWLIQVHPALDGSEVTFTLVFQLKSKLNCKRKRNLLAFWYVVFFHIFFQTRVKNLKLASCQFPTILEQVKPLNPSDSKLGYGGYVVY